MGIRNVFLGILTIAMATVFTTIAFAAEPHCDVDFMMESAKDTAVKSFIASRGLRLDLLEANLEEYSGGGITFGDCCWTKKSLVVKAKNSGQVLATYKLMVGNNWGEYKKGICQISVSQTENFVDLKDSEACFDKAESYAKTAVDLLATASPAKGPSESHLAYDILKANVKVGTLMLSPVACRFQQYETEMQKLANESSPMK